MPPVVSHPFISPHSVVGALVGDGAGGLVGDVAGALVVDAAGDAGVALVSELVLHRSSCCFMLLHTAGSSVGVLVGALVGDAVGDTVGDVGMPILAYKNSAMISNASLFGDNHPPDTWWSVVSELMWNPPTGPLP